MPDTLYAPAPAEADAPQSSAGRRAGAVMSTNAVQYGRSGMAVALALVGETLRIDVTDLGEPMSRPAPLSDDEHGRGLDTVGSGRCLCAEAPPVPPAARSACPAHGRACSPYLESTRPSESGLMASASRAAFQAEFPG